MPRKGTSNFLKFTKAILTYTHHIDKDKLKIFINSKCNINKIEVAHESADDECPYLHTHAVVWFTKQYTMSTPRSLDINWDRTMLIKVDEKKRRAMKAKGKNYIHPNVKTLPGKGKKAYEDALGYISKEDPECENLKRFKESNLVQRVWNYDNKEDMMKDMINSANEAMGIMTIWKEKNLMQRTKRKIKLIWHWHDELDQILTSLKNMRAIRWYYSKEGNTGKTEFCRWMLQEYPNDTLVFKRFGGVSNMSHLVIEHLKTGKDLKYVLVDLPRHYKDVDNIYECLEDLIDGMFTSTKYMGGFVDIDTPHIVVFANFEPNVTTMSKDRWIIKELKHFDNNVVIFPKTYEQILKINEANKEAKSVVDGSEFPSYWTNK
jgi:hypothetical protein